MPKNITCRSSECISEERAQNFFNQKASFLKRLMPLFSALILIAILTIGTFLLHSFGYSVVYSGSISMPRGFYAVTPVGEIQRGDIVLFHAPESAAQLIRQNHWGPRSGLLLKHVVGLPGDSVCERGGTLWLNGQSIVPVYRFYAPGKELPHASFCGRLAFDQYLLLSKTIARSFDSRYFGPIKRENILGKGYLFW